MSQDWQQQKLEDLLQDKDVLMTKLEACADFLSKEVVEVDRTVRDGIKKEIDTKVKGIRDGQHDRNRRVVKQIIETCAQFKSEIEDDVA